VLVLALDTTTRAGSTALVEDGRVRLERSGEPSITHGQRLPGDLQRAFVEAGLDRAALDRLAVAAGPGSFTGLRVGIAAIQGLAMALNLRVVPVSALDALACTAVNARNGAGEGPIGVWMDAQRGQVFAALYDGAGRTPLIDPTALPPEDTLRWWMDRIPERPVRFIGDGAVRYDAAIRRAVPEARIEAPPPLAGTVGLIAHEHPERAVLPHAIAPIYIRRPDAEIARDSRRVPR
jgi:tRNA threonylcarbamoyladenosine biosynthesis protein TsaB